MYTVEQLQNKSLKELKEIGWELNLLPAGDKRCRQNWIDVIVGVQPPLLKLLEVSPSVDRLRNRSIEEIDFAECDELTFFELLELCRNTDKKLADKSLKHLQHLRTKVLDLTGRPGGGSFLGNKTHRASWVREVRYQLASLVRTRSLVKAPRGLGRVEELLWKALIIEDFDALLLHVQFFPQTKDVPGAIEVQHQEPIGKTFPDSETSPGVTFSSRFLARYFPPQPERIFYKAGADGQLSLLEFEVESADEPPDPDDYSTEFEFWAAYEVWCDCNPDVYDLMAEPAEIQDLELVQFQPQESIETSLVSMSYWARCPDEWYELVIAFEDASRCPCGAMPAPQCDGTTATHIYPDRIVFTPCYKNDLDGMDAGLVLRDRVSARSPPGGDVMR